MVKGQASTPMREGGPVHNGGLRIATFHVQLDHLVGSRDRQVLSYVVNVNGLTAAFARAWGT